MSPPATEQEQFLRMKVDVLRKMFDRSQTWQFVWLICLLGSLIANGGMAYLLLRR
jgi:hypothetical protein